MMRKWIAAAAVLLFSTMGTGEAFAETWQYQAAEQPGPGTNGGAMAEEPGSVRGCTGYDGFHGGGHV